MEARGMHCLGSFYGCSRSLLSDAETLIRWSQEACREAKATILNTTSYKFEPEGVTILVLLAESHLSIHTYPEHNTIFLDVFTCGNLDSSKAVAFLEERIRPASAKIDIVERF